MKDEWRSKMEKDFDDLNDSLLKKQDQEVLEISSTGYGLESIIKESEEASKTKEHKDRHSSTYE